MGHDDYINQIHYEEWQLWQDVVKELRSLGIEINNEDGLNDALVAWGKACDAVGKLN